jgi:hypothetical protein
MHATIRRYEGVDASRTDELVRMVDEKLVPVLSKLEGFGGYYLIETGEGAVTSVSIFDTPAQADESSRVAATWVRDEGLQTALPNAPAVTGGTVVAHMTSSLASA